MNHSDVSVAILLYTYSTYIEKQAEVTETNEQTLRLDSLSFIFFAGSNKWIFLYSTFRVLRTQIHFQIAHNTRSSMSSFMH